MRNRHLPEKRPREDALPESALPHEALASEADDNKQRAIAARRQQADNAQDYFQRAKNIYLRLILQLDNEIYARNPHTQVATVIQMNANNSAAVFRYVEVITALGELLLEFEQYDEAEPYLLEYIHLKEQHQTLRDNLGDTLANDYFNLGIIRQTRFGRTNQPTDLLASTTWLIKSLSSYRSLRDKAECHDTAIQILANFIAQHKLAKPEYVLESDSVKELLQMVIADVLPIQQLHHLSASPAQLELFLSPKQWQHRYKPKHGAKSSKQEKDEAAKIVKLQKEFTPEIFVVDNCAPKRAKKEKSLKFENPNSNQLPAGYGLWTPPVEAPPPLMDDFNMFQGHMTLDEEEIFYGINSTYLF